MDSCLVENCTNGYYGHCVRSDTSNSIYKSSFLNNERAIYITSGGQETTYLFDKCRINGNETGIGIITEDVVLTINRSSSEIILPMHSESIILRIQLLMQLIITGEVRQQNRWMKMKSCTILVLSQTISMIHEKDLLITTTICRVNSLAIPFTITLLRKLLILPT